MIDQDAILQVNHILKINGLFYNLIFFLYINFIVYC